MAPSKLGGRPKLPWNASRKRKLVRLYLMTNLKIEDIKQVLNTDDFNPGTRNIQAQLSDLLPEIMTEWRQYRPSEGHQGRRRLKRLKRCHQNQIAKHLQKRRRLKSTTKDPAHAPSVSTFEKASPWYNPNRHYEEEAPFGIPSHFSLPFLSAWYLAQSSQKLMPNENICLSTEKGDSYSDKEVVETTEPSSSRQLQASATNLLSCASNIAISPLAVDPISEPLPDAGEYAHTMPSLRRSNSRVSSLGSVSARSVSTSISSKLSDGLSFVKSIMSQSNSWRSSLIYAMSLSSGGLSTMSQYAFSCDELNSWKEFVDESNLASGSSSQSDIGAISLYFRPCCFFFEKDIEKRTRCTTCGFSEIHQLVRFSNLAYLNLVDGTSIDRFGNTILHHAAAAGNLERVLQLLSATNTEQRALLQLRNTSGETFLHVIRFEGPSAFPEYLEILGKASSEGFDFGTQTYRGKSVFQRFDELIVDFEADPIQLRHAVARSILGLTDDASIDEPVELHGFSTTLDTVCRSSPSLAMDFRQVQENEERETETKAQSTLNDARLNGSQSSEAANIPTGHSNNNPRTQLFSPFSNSPQAPELQAQLFKTSNISPYHTDNNHPTQLFSALGNWQQDPKSRSQLTRIIEESDIHMRDELGYTALALAARQGLYKAVSLLLEHGANPNTRSCQRTSVLLHTAAYLARAQKENDERLYARILSCMALLSDYGAKELVSVLDEYSVYIPPVNKGKKKARLYRRNDRKLRNHLPVINANISDTSAEERHPEASRKINQDTSSTQRAGVSLPFVQNSVFDPKVKEIPAVIEEEEGGTGISESQGASMPFPVVQESVFEMDGSQTASMLVPLGRAYDYALGSLAEYHHHRTLEPLRHLTTTGPDCIPPTSFSEGNSLFRQPEFIETVDGSGIGTTQSGSSNPAYHGYLNRVSVDQHYFCSPMITMPKPIDATPGRLSLEGCSFNAVKDSTSFHDPGARRITAQAGFLASPQRDANFDIARSSLLRRQNDHLTMASMSSMSLASDRGNDRSLPLTDTGIPNVVCTRGGEFTYDQAADANISSRTQSQLSSVSNQVKICPSLEDQALLVDPLIAFQGQVHESSATLDDACNKRTWEAYEPNKSSTSTQASVPYQFWTSHSPGQASQDSDSLEDLAQYDTNSWRNVPTKMVNPAPASRSRVWTQKPYKRQKTITQ